MGVRTMRCVPDITDEMISGRITISTIWRKISPGKPMRLLTSLLKMYIEKSIRQNIGRRDFNGNWGGQILFFWIACSQLVYKGKSLHFSFAPPPIMLKGLTVQVYAKIYAKIWDTSFLRHSKDYLGLNGRITKPKTTPSTTDSMVRTRSRSDFIQLIHSKAVIE